MKLLLQIFLAIYNFILKDYFLKFISKLGRFIENVRFSLALKRTWINCSFSQKRKPNPNPKLSFLNTKTSPLKNKNICLSPDKLHKKEFYLKQYFFNRTLGWTVASITFNLFISSRQTTKLGFVILVTRRFWTF